jgi:ubiquinone/menaquinone biosynthesis C-methylase UbiE
LNDRQFKGEIDRLRSPRRIDMMEVPRVVALCRENRDIKGVLDVGTGSGIFAEAFAAAGMAVSGIDIREDMLEAARQFVPDGDFAVGRMEALPFEEESIDLVFLGHVFHEADDLEQALGEAARVARQRVAIFEWIHRKEDFGPPLDHRLTEETVASVARPIGFARAKTTLLEHMVLYRFDV